MTSLFCVCVILTVISIFHVSADSNADQDYSYQAAIIIMKTKVNMNFLCTTTIIHKFWVLTVKDCLSKYVNHLKVLRVLVGTTDITKGGSAHKIILKVGHKTNQHDVPIDAILLRMNTSFTLKDTVKPIALSYGGCYSNENKYKIYTTGWRQPTGQNSIEIAKTDLKVIEYEKCQQIYKNLSLNGICTNGNICDLSVGSPVIADYNGQRYLVGVTNKIYPCESDKPHVHMEIAYLYEWIMSNIQRFTP